MYVVVVRFEPVCVDRIVWSPDRRSFPMGWRFKPDIHVLGWRWVGAISLWVGIY